MDAEEFLSALRSTDEKWSSAIYAMQKALGDIIAERDLLEENLHPDDVVHQRLAKMRKQRK